MRSGAEGERASIRAALCKSLRQLAEARAPEGSFCPSEAARAVCPEDWRAWMEEVRRVAAALIEAGELEATQRGQMVDLATARGAIRLRRSGSISGDRARLSGESDEPR